MKSFDELGLMINTELKEIMEDKAKKIKSAAENAHSKDFGSYNYKIEIKGGTSNKCYLQVSFWGQRMWTDEFGKGLGIGLFTGDTLFDSKHREIPHNYERANFKRSIYWKQYTSKNPYRKNGGFKNTLIVNGNGQPIKKRQRVTVTRNGKKYTQYREMKQYFKERDTARDVRIYSRPGGYRDIDGTFHSSNVKGIFPIENPRRLAQGKEQVSHGGSLRISDTLGYNFITNKQTGTPITLQEAGKITDKIAAEVEEYLHDLF